MRQRIVAGNQTYARIHGLANVWKYIKPEEVSTFYGYSSNKHYVLIERVAFTSRGEAVPSSVFAVIDTVNGGVTDVKKPSERKFKEAAISPNGQTVAVVSYQADDIWLMGSTGNESRKLLTNDRKFATISGLRWNEDSTQVAFVVERHDPSDMRDVQKYDAMSVSSAALTTTSQAQIIASGLAGQIELSQVGNSFTVNAQGVQSMNLSACLNSLPGMIRAGNGISLKMPFAEGSSTITQGYCGTVSHGGLGYAKALDIGGPRLSLGQPILAVAAGTVHDLIDGSTKTACVLGNDPVGAYGNRVVVRHVGINPQNNTSITYFTRSAHIAVGGVAVDRGATIEQGRRLGTVGCTGNTDGPHTHFEMRRDDPFGAEVIPEPMDGQSNLPTANTSGFTVFSTNREGGGGGGSCPSSYPSPPSNRTPGDPNTPVVITSPQVVLNWACVSNATSYGVYVSRDPYGSANLVVNRDYVPGTSLDITSSLQPNTTYRWNMISFQGTNYNGSQFSNVLYFRWQPEQPVSIGISPTTGFTYPDVRLGQFSDNIFTVRNTGGGTLMGTASVAPPFSIVGNASYSLGAGQAQNITVRFTPTARQSYVSQNVTFTGGGGASAPVSGRGVAPVWQSNGPTLDFTAGTVGGNPVSSGFNVRNVGDATGNFTITATNGFVPTPSSGSLAAGASAVAQATAPACSSVGTQTSVITITGEGSTYTINASRTCNPAIPSVGISSLTMSSDGRIFLAWPEQNGATSYGFQATFDGLSITVNGSTNARSGGTSGAVAQFVTAPEAADKQGKQICMSIRANNAGGAGAWSTPTCTTYRYYTGITAQGAPELPQLWLE